jgi:hypothetical protein
MHFVLQNIVWQRSERLHVIGCLTVLVLLCKNSKYFIPCNPTFGEEVFVYLQEDMSKIKSESECAIGSDYKVRPFALLPKLIKEGPRKVCNVEWLPGIHK